METLRLRLSLEGVQSPEIALIELQEWLQSNGIRVELERLPPTEEELGGKAVALVLICSLLNESIGEALHEVDHWQRHQQHPTMQPVLHLTGQPQPDEPIREKVKQANLHIELREPEPPPDKEKAQVIAPPPPKPPVKKIL